MKPCVQVHLAATLVASLIVCTIVSGQIVNTDRYRLKATDPGVDFVVKELRRLAPLVGLKSIKLTNLELRSEVSVIHGERRPLWQARYNNILQFKMDMATGKTLSYWDFAREEAQFKGTQPKQVVKVRTKEQAKSLLLDIARRLGIPTSCVPDSFNFLQNPGEPRFSAGRAGMTFKNAAGERVAGLSIDILDGGLNNYWFAAWKANASSVHD